MILNPVRLKLPTQVLTSAITSGPHLRIAQQLNPETFGTVYKQQISQEGLSDEKAVSLAIRPAQSLPAINDLMLRHLRS